MASTYLEIFIAIAANEVELLAEFYQKLLKQPPQTQIPSVYAEFQLSQLRLGIFKPNPNNQNEFTNHNSSMSLCLEVADLEQAIALMTELGCPPLGEIIEASHGREIYAYDPEGNRLILHQSPKV